MNRSIFNRLAASGLLLGAVLLAAGCAKHGGDQTENAAENVAGVTVPLNETPPQPAIAEANAAEAPALTAETPLSDEQQMQEDAAATGMTSRLPAEAQDNDAGEAAPAQ